VLGWVPDELVDRVYRVADIACFPGVQRETLDVYGDVRAVHCTDALPRGVMEPMSYGVAVVATGVAGIEKVVEDRKTGLLVRPSDPDALAAAIVELASQPDTRACLARAGKAFIEDACSVSAHLDQMMALYDDLLRSPPPSRSRLWS
jgi:glycosyltransferase involved in cell wall biosynthesis